MNLVIRLANLDDAAKIAGFNLAIARESGDDTPNRRIVARGVRAILTEPHHGFYVVADDGKKLVGMAMITYEWSDTSSRQWWWLHNLVADANMEQPETLSQIYGFIHEMAERQGNVCGIRLYVDKKDRKAQRRFRSIGLEKTNFRLMELPIAEKKVSPRKAIRRKS